MPQRGWCPIGRDAGQNSGTVRGMSAQEDEQDRKYRDLIDRLVDDCRRGQGQIGADRARAGVWNPNATPDFIPEQHEINALLARMPVGDREILARMLAEAFVGGVHSALVALHEAEMPPFDKAYEGTPFSLGV